MQLRAFMYNWGVDKPECVLNENDQITRRDIADDTHFLQPAHAISKPFISPASDDQTIGECRLESSLQQLCDVEVRVST